MSTQSTESDEGEQSDEQTDEFNDSCVSSSQSEQYSFEGDFGDTVCVTDLECYETIGSTFKAQPTVGETIEGSVVEFVDSPLTDVLERVDGEYSNREYVVMEHGTVDRVATERVRLQKDSFDSFVKWYIMNHMTNGELSETVQNYVTNHMNGMLVTEDSE